MKYYIIDQKSEIKPKRNQLMGRPSDQIKEDYKKLQKYIGKRYLNHGNNVAHTLGLVRNQLNKKRDREVFTPNGRSINLHISRGLCFTKNCSQLYARKDRDELELIQNLIDKYPFALFITPAMYLYHRKPIEKLIEDGKGILYDGNIPSYDHQSDVNTYEYRIDDADDLPDPAYIIIGKNAGKDLIEENRINFEAYALLIKELYPETILIYLKHVYFGTNKNGTSTGNELTPLTGKKLMDAIYNIKQGRYKCKQI